MRDVRGRRKGINKKAIAVGAVALIALAVIAMVYYSAYSTTTVTAKKILDTSVASQSVTMYAPGITTEAVAGTVTVNIYDPDTTKDDTVRYRLIIDIPMLKKMSGEWGNIRSLAIAVYDSNGYFRGFLTPWTPTLVIEDTVAENESSSPDFPDDGSAYTVTYTLKVNGIAWKDMEMKLGIRASVELLSVS